MNAKFLRIISAIVTGVVILLLVAIRLLGPQLRDEPTLGWLLFGAFTFAMSAACFFGGAFPFRTLGGSDATLRRAYRFAWVSLIFSFLQIPIWSVMTWRYPPDGFTETQAVFATLGVLVSLFGPAAPSICGFLRLIASANKRQRAQIAAKKAARGKPKT